MARGDMSNRVRDFVLSYLIDHPGANSSEITANRNLEWTKGRVSVTLSQLFERGALKREYVPPPPGAGGIGTFNYWIDEEGLKRFGERGYRPNKGKLLSGKDGGGTRARPPVETPPAAVYDGAKVGQQTDTSPYAQAQDFVLQELVDHPGTASWELFARRPLGMTDAAISGALFQFFNRGAVRRESGVSPTGRATFRHWLINVNPIAAIAERNGYDVAELQAKINKPTVDDLPTEQELDTLMQTTSEAAPAVVVQAPRVLPIAPPVAVQPRGLPTLTIPTDSGAYSFSLGEARVLYDQLKLVFGG